MRDDGLLKFFGLFFLVFSVIFLSQVVHAQNYGCCCDPVTFSGSLVDESSCQNKGFIFLGLPDRFGTSCDDFCQAKLFAPRVPVCGDNVCEGDEPVTCPSDCTAPSPKTVVCGSPGYIPPPKAVTITPIKGEKKFRLEFSEECPPAYFEVWRNRGGSSTTFDFVAEVHGDFFVDDSPDLKWNTDYLYDVKAVYIPEGTSIAKTASANLGDLECWHNSLPVFCLNNIFYSKFEDYLKDKGYGTTSGASFRLNFNSSVASAFASRFNKAFYCSDSNELVLAHSCTSPDVCAINSSGEAFCIAPSACNISGFFGLFSDKNDCLFENNMPAYCFFDKSKSVVDACYPCVQGMECYDYKSQSACEADSCGVGNCEWHSTTHSLGFGVCVNKKKSNCEFCGLAGSAVAPNKDAFSQVFDSCSEAKASALSVPGFECVYWKDYDKVLSCDEVTCLHYSELQFTPPSPGIRLNSDNSLNISSYDPCHIGVCQLDPETHKFRKNADGNAGSDWADCPLGDVACEADYFPPLTSVIPAGKNQTDFLNIVIMDKLNKTDTVKNYAGSEGYETFLCLKTSANSCSDAGNFPLRVSTNRLILKNLELKDGRTKLADLSEGPNTLLFYSKDKYNNPEVVKSVVFDACKDCQGPTLLDVKISGGRLFGSTLFSSLSEPVITLFFDEPTEIVHASLSNSPAQPIADSGFDFDRSIKFDRSLSEDYFRLFVKVKNRKGIVSDLLFTISIDTSLASLVISPDDGEIVPSRDVTINLSFNKQADLRAVLLTHLSSGNPFVLNESVEDILADFSTSDRRLYSASFTGLDRGVYKLFVEAEDLRGFPIAKESRFSVGVDDFIVLKEPDFGYSDVQTFNVKFETGIKYFGNGDECRYAFNLPAMPSVDETTFTDFPKAGSVDGYVHETSALTIPYGGGAHPLYIFCKNGDDFQFAEFDLFVDSAPPKIVKAYAFPSVISEESIVNPGTFSTKLKVETDKPSFCKYSRLTDNFDLMESSFEASGSMPKNVHSTIVVVDEIKEHNFFVACKSPAGVVSDTAEITFSINLSLPLQVNVVTDRVFNDSDFVIGVETNKRSLCYLGNDSFNIHDCFGDCRPGYVHSMERVVDDDGRYKFFVRCSVALTGESSAILPVTIVVDQTPPEMLWVNDSSALADPEVSFFKDRLGVAFLGNDSGSGISYYLVSVVESLTGELVSDWVESLVVDGSFHYIENISLENNKKYEVDVKAVDNAGWESLPLSSDGVFVNFSAEPESCSNNVTDGNETDVDCGGPCAPCALGLSCVVDSDCASGLCNGSVCVEPVSLCDDGVKDGDETDVDCGGSCIACEDGLDCYVDADCASGYCDGSTGTCRAVPSCEDGLLSAGETDVDCGGPCAPCALGKSCEVDVDCDSGLECIDSVCSETREAPVVEVVDSDNDGVPDNDDFCPDTPSGESVDEYGCSSSQRGVEEVKEKKGHGVLWFFLIILLLAGLGVGGYLLYNYLVEKGALKPIVLPKFKPKVPKMQRLPAAKPSVGPRLPSHHLPPIRAKPVVPKKPSAKEKLEELSSRLRKFAKEAPESGWVEIKGKKKKQEEIFEQLRSRFKGDEEKKALRQLKQKIPKSNDKVFQKLKKLKKDVEEKKKKRRG